MSIAIDQPPRLPGLSQNGRWRVDTFTVKACIESLQKEVSKVEAAALAWRIVIGSSAGETTSWQPLK
jgi:hypothetical protein